MNFELYRTTINGTVNTAGNISLDADRLERKIWLLSAFCDQGFSVLPYYANKKWGCKLITSSASGVISVVSSQNVTIQCLWIRLK